MKLIRNGLILAVAIISCRVVVTRALASHNYLGTTPCQLLVQYDCDGTDDAAGDLNPDTGTVITSTECGYSMNIPSEGCGLELGPMQSE